MSTSKSPHSRDHQDLIKKAAERGATIYYLFWQLGGISGKLELLCKGSA